MVPSIKRFDEELARLKREEELKKLRDQFAGQAMQGMVAAIGGGGVLLDPNPKTLASAAYAIADAMLEARKA